MSFSFEGWSQLWMRYTSESLNIFLHPRYPFLYLYHQPQLWHSFWGIVSFWENLLGLSYHPLCIRTTLSSWSILQSHLQLDLIISVVVVSLMEMTIFWFISLSRFLNWIKVSYFGLLEFLISVLHQYPFSWGVQGSVRFRVPHSLVSSISQHFLFIINVGMHSTQQVLHVVGLLAP